MYTDFATVSYTYIPFTLMCQYIKLFKILLLIMPLRSSEIGKPEYQF